jgi:protein gp37
MGKNTLIEWTESTLNLGWGCTKVSAGCENCYMFRNSYFYGTDPTKIRYFSIKNAEKRIREYGEKIFVNSNTDTFHEQTPFYVIDEWFRLFKRYPQKQFQILTKRTNRMRKYFEDKVCPDNVWLGTSVEDQQHVFRIDTLKRIDAKIRFVSFEPVLGAIKTNLENIQWAIIGGESDKSNPRIMERQWALDLIDEIKRQGTKLFFKQWGGIGGSGAGGDLVDGKQYHEFPDYNQGLLVSY